MDHLRLGLPDAFGKIQQRFAERFVGVDQFHRLFDCACGLCVGQQIPDKGLCTMGALDDKIQELTAALVESARVVLLQNLRVNRNVSKRRSEEHTSELQSHLNLV